MSVLRRTVLFVACLVACVPRPAHAAGFVNLGVGLSFGSAAAQGRANAIVGVGFLSREPIGVELDIGYAPRFFKSPEFFTQNRLATVMGNVIVAGFDRGGRPGGRGRGVALRPYVSGGFGLMSETVETAGGRVSNNHLGFNAGIGVMTLGRHVLGLRADLRYFRDLIGTQGGNATGINFGGLHFLRGSVGIIVTF